MLGLNGPSRLGQFQATPNVTLDNHVSSSRIDKWDDEDAVIILII